jgi:PAS domain S-box-containing protein
MGGDPGPDVDRRLGEDENARVSAQLRDVLESTTDAFIGLDRALVVTYFNAAAEKLLGRRRQDFLGRYLFDAFPEGRGTVFDEKFQQALREGEPLSFDVLFEVPRYRNWYDVRTFPHRDGLSVFFQVSTERRQAEAALRLSEKTLRNLFDNTEVAMFRSKLDGSATLTANERFCELVGRPPEEVIGKPSVVYWVDPRRREEMIRLLRAEGRVKDFEFQMVNARGELRDCITSLNLYADTGTLDGSILDITDLKRAEEARERLHEQLSQAQKMESVGRLAGGVAHDFNNMLGVILGHVDLALQQVPGDSPLRAHLEEIQAAGRRSADLTRQLLGFARKQDVAPRVLDLNATVEGMLNMLRRLIGENVELAWRPGASLSAVKVDAGQISQILANLCVNSRDAIEGIGKVSIETGDQTFSEAFCAEHAGHVPGNYVMLAVSDTGCGMDAETRAHLFEPFFTTKGIGRGTGLGLATIYGIVQQNAGFVTVESERGCGTTFRIYLPRYERDAAAPREDAVARAAGRGHETIMLVEDEPALLRFGKRVLESLGYSVLAALRPMDAIRIAEQRTTSIHLLVSDVIMPDMNGRVLATRLVGICPGLKCLFMSGYTADVIAHESVLDDGVHFLQKPFSGEDLGAKVREVLDTAAPADLIARSG